MTTVLCTCDVADYEAFRAGYDRALEAFGEQIRSYRLWRGQDDPNVVVIEETFDSREIAERLWNDPRTKAAMEADGIDMSTVRIEYLDEVDAGHS
jgi:quinol monooxygenase YgiN